VDLELAVMVELEELLHLQQHLLIVAAAVAVLEEMHLIKVLQVVQVL